MDIANYENVWKAALIHVTDEFSLPPVVLSIIGTLGNFSVSTGQGESKEDFQCECHRCCSPC